MSPASRASSSAASIARSTSSSTRRSRRANDPSEKERLSALKGKVAIANAKLAYQDYKKLFAGPRWEKLAAKGAKPQRLLWASTGTKNKDYSDVLYVEELIGPNTVNTVPPATLDAFRDHGKPRDSLEENVEDARRVLEELEKSGISLDAITEELVKDGVKLFADAADKLYGAVAHKRAASLGGGIDHAAACARRRHHEGCREEHRGMARLGDHPPAVAEGQIGLDRRRREQMAGLAEQPRRGRYRRLRGFCAPREGTEFHRRGRARHGRLEPRAGSAGGDVRARNAGFPKLHVLDSTDPAQVRAMEEAVDLAKTLFIVSSKSGGTTEPNVMKDYFFDRVAKTIGKDKAGHRFIAVTDPGSSLEKVAHETGLCPHLPRRSNDRRTLFRAVAVRPGAGGSRRHRHPRSDHACARDGALLRRRRAAA